MEVAKADLEWTSTHKDEIITWLKSQLSTSDGNSNTTTNIVIIVAFLMILLT